MTEKYPLSVLFISCSIRLCPSHGCDCILSYLFKPGTFLTAVDDSDLADLTRLLIWRVKNGLTAPTHNFS
jgi:hypothetical protein